LRIKAGLKIGQNHTNLTFSKSVRKARS